MLISLDENTNYRNISSIFNEDSREFISAKKKTSGSCSIAITNKKKEQFCIFRKRKQLFLSAYNKMKATYFASGILVING